jgi:hypothetical protein
MLKLDKKRYEQETKDYNHILFEASQAEGDRRKCILKPKKCLSPYMIFVREVNKVFTLDPTLSN